MIKKISDTIANKIALYSLNEENKEIYSYGLQILINTICSISIVLVLGILFNEFIGTTAFLLCYCLFRLFAGGLHVSTNARCIMTFVCGYVVVCVCVKTVIISLNVIVIISLMIINLAVILFAPVDDIYNPISIRKKREMKRVAFFISLIITFVVFIALYKNCWIGRWGYAGLSWACMIMVVGKTKNTIISRR